MSVETLVLLASLYLSLFCNGAFWQQLVALEMFRTPGGWLTATGLFVAMTALHAMLLGTVATRSSIRPLLALLFLLTSLVVHYINQYHVYFDADMMRNVLHTDRRESGELISAGLILPVLLYGVLPSILLWQVQLTHRTWQRATLLRVACLVGALILATSALLVSFQGISSLMRNHKELRYLVTPGNFLVSGASVAFDRSRKPAGPKLAVGTDAQVAARPTGSKPRLLVVVVGETVRAQNWGLNGYQRQTTPQLSRLDVVNFPNTRACGSSTEISLPCMFSPYGRTDYDRDRIEDSQSLLHVLDHAGIQTLWRDNQSGCKGVCEGLAFDSVANATDPELCDSERCLDEILLRGLRGKIDPQPRDTVVVLHQLGNHGPAYFLRYPKRLEKFTPTCQDMQLGHCSREQIVNSYDNAVLYTDHVIAKTIGLLRSDEYYDSALIYVSDHGESLGENGLYLHGVPYPIAPDTQLRVPMVMWFSPGMIKQRGMDMVCVKQAASGPSSHDNLFHSVLGLMQVSTSDYKPGRDLLADCVATG